MSALAGDLTVPGDGARVVADAAAALGGDRVGHRRGRNADGEHQDVLQEDRRLLAGAGCEQNVDAVTRAVVAKLLHHPSVRLKEDAGTPRGERNAAAVRDLDADELLALRDAGLGQEHLARLLVDREVLVLAQLRDDGVRAQVALQHRGLAFAPQWSQRMQAVLLAAAAVDGKVRRFSKGYRRYRADSDHAARKYKGSVVRELGLLALGDVHVEVGAVESWRCSLLVGLAL